MSLAQGIVLSHGTLDLRGGWHDAVDYNKYVWGDLALAVLPLLRAFEDHPSIFPDGGLSIPEAGNGTPDLLDEIRWELDTACSASVIAYEIKDLLCAIAPRLQ